MGLSEEKIQNHFNDKDLTVTHLKDFGLKILQPKEGYRFSIDALLLAEFVNLKKRAQVAEFGSGTGVISLILSKRFPNAHITGIEIQKRPFELSVKNIDINKISNVSFLNLDIKRVKDFFSSGSFDHVITNPPFRPASSGRLCLNSQEALSRHEILINLQEIIESARWLLKPGGRFSIIYPAERLSYLISIMTQKRLEPKRLRCIHPQKGLFARLVLVEGVKDAGIELRIEPPVFINQ